MDPAPPDGGRDLLFSRWSGLWSGAVGWGLDDPEFLALIRTIETVPVLRQREGELQRLLVAYVLILILCALASGAVILRSPPISRPSPRPSV